MLVTNDDEKKAYTEAVNALTTVTLDEAKVKTLNYNSSTVEQWVTNASTAKIKGTEAVANEEFFVVNEDDKTIALTGKIVDLKLNIDKVKKAAPELNVTLAQGASQKTKLSVSAGSNKVYISKVVKSKSTDAFVVGDVLEIINYVEISDTVEVSKSDLNAGIVDSQTFAVVEVDAENKVVKYGFVTITESADFRA